MPSARTRRTTTRRARPEEIAEIREHLARRPLPEIPCRWFYDARGGELFERITELPEYYPTRTEIRILEECAARVVARVRPRAIAELGSGSARKIRLLLDAGHATLDRCAFLDVNEAALDASVADVRRAHPDLDVVAVPGDFLRDLDRLGPGGGPRLLLFLAGTLGNLAPPAVPAFFRDVARIVAPGDAFLLGVDLVKDPARLHAAYNDLAGVTAEFNKNALRVVNGYFGSDFDPDDFDHVAFWDARNEWIEMRLRARRAVRTRVADMVLELPAGGEIRTELSCKYTRASLGARLAGTGLRIAEWFTDPEALFADVLLVREGESGSG